MLRSYEIWKEDSAEKDPKSNLHFFFSFAGYESIAYTTHSDATFLENLIPLTERWRGPVSIAIYVPGKNL